VDQRTPSGDEAAARIERAEAIFAGHEIITMAACVDGEPWVAKAYFVEDEPASGRLDICCGLLMSPGRRDSLVKTPRVAFMVGGDVPDRWISGLGTAELLDDDADVAAVLKRVSEKAQQAGPFLETGEPIALRIHVERLKVTDLSAEPPVAEFTFA